MNGSAVRDAEYALEHATLSAPFDAVVATRSVAIFPTINAGTPVVRRHDLSELRIEIDVPEILFQLVGNDPNLEFAARLPASDALLPLEYREIVEVGQRVDLRLDELWADLPYGVDIESIYQQHSVVEDASNAFPVNLAMSVGIVVIVLALFMGWRAAVVVGSTLLLTVLGTLLVMKFFSIEMERISLGALII